MLFPIKDREDLQNLIEIKTLQNQIQEVRLQDKLGKQNYHHKTEKLIESVTDTI